MVRHEPGSKRHAVRKDDPDSPLYWVGNDTDWHEVRRKPRIPLECPERCGVELIAVENPAYRYSPRFFRIKPPRPPCDHWEPPPGHGGRESAQHDWLKNKLAEIVRDLGYIAVVEHWPTYADVYVESSPPFCLEVQLKPTSFDARTRARQNHGARVCWLIRDSLNTPGASETLARGQAVRFRVVDGSRRVAQPWHDTPGSVLADSPRIEVFMAIATRPDDWLKPGELWFRTHGYLDARQFLDEILSGRRRPYSGPELGLRQAAWALDTDVVDYRAFSRQMAARRVSRPVSQQVQAPAPRPNPPAERVNDHDQARAGTQTDDRERAMIREQAAADLAWRIHQTEARIEALEEYKAKLAADAEGLGSTATGNQTLGPDLELRALTSQLAILRRQEAMLTERPTDAPRPPPYPPPAPIPTPLPAPAAPSLPAQRPWWQWFVRRRNTRG